MSRGKLKKSNFSKIKHALIPVERNSRSANVPQIQRHRYVHSKSLFLWANAAQLLS